MFFLCGIAWEFDSCGQKRPFDRCVFLLYRGRLPKWRGAMKMLADCMHRLSYIPRCAMYGIFTYIYHKIYPKVGKYTIHGHGIYRCCLSCFQNQLFKNTSPRCLHRTVAGYLLFQCIPGDVHPSCSTHRCKMWGPKVVRQTQRIHGTGIFAYMKTININQM